MISDEESKRYILAVWEEFERKAAVHLGPVKAAILAQDGMQAAARTHNILSARFGQCPQCQQQAKGGK